MATPEVPSRGLRDLVANLTRRFFTFADRIRKVRSAFEFEIESLVKDGKSRSHRRALVPLVVVIKRRSSR